MGSPTFPTLLTKKATLMGSLTRYDLATLGGSYLVLSWMKVSGLYALAINALLLLIIKLAKKWLRPGFFVHLLDSDVSEWRLWREDRNE